MALKISGDFAANEHIIVAFDVDGTLIHQVGEKEDTPRYDMVQLFKMFENLGCKMVIWSGGGIEYAERWRDKLGLNAEVVAKGSIRANIAFDDCEADLASVDVRV